MKFHHYKKAKVFSLILPIYFKLYFPFAQLDWINILYKMCTFNVRILVFYTNVHLKKIFMCVSETERERENIPYVKSHRDQTSIIPWSWQRRSGCIAAGNQTLVLWKEENPS